MPIEYDFPLKVLSQDEFHAIDRVVMRQAFDVQNELGRLYHEDVYRNELEFRLQSQGLSIISEAHIRVVFNDFIKHYFVDSLVGGGAVYELKAAEALVGAHDSQLLNYLFLLGIYHGKLINFYPTSVEYRFVSTRLSCEMRHHVTFDSSLWQELEAGGRPVLGLLSDMLSDWGAFLDAKLYEEALGHFLCPDDLKGHVLEVCVGGRVIGAQTVCLLQDTVALHVSSIVKNHSAYRKHLERLFDHTRLTGIQWVNFNRNKVEMISLKK